MIGWYYDIGISHADHKSKESILEEYNKGIRRKDIINRDILIKSGNNDRKVTQPNEITGETIKPVHFFQKLLMILM